jgi:hypothetical protein
MTAALPLGLGAFAPAAAATLGASAGHGGDAEPTLMAAPDAHATLMAVPGAAPAKDDHADDDMDGMAGMDDHSSRDATMPSVATPDAPQRQRVLAGFAAVNALVLGAAAYLRRKGGTRRSPRAAAPARATRNSTSPDGGAA